MSTVIDLQAARALRAEPEELPTAPPPNLGRPDYSRRLQVGYTWALGLGIDWGAETVGPLTREQS